MPSIEQQLYDNGFSEDEIAQSLDVTHVALRKAMDNPPVQLSRGALEELRAVHSTLTVPEVMKHYRCSRAEAHKALFTNSPETLCKPQDGDIATYFALQPVIDVGKAAQAFGCSRRHIVNRARALGILSYCPNSTGAEKDAALAMIKGKGCTYEEIAALLGRSQSWVSSIAIANGIKGSPKPRRNQNPDWVQILRDAKKCGNIAAVARAHNISRSAIYARMKK